MEKAANPIVRNLQIVFIISTVLLVISLISSLYSIREMNDSSLAVNHTNEVLIESERIISSVRDGETAQRAYLITHEQEFLKPYNEAQANALDALANTKDLTIDNPIQQKNLEDARLLIEERFTQMQKLVDQDRQAAALSQAGAEERRVQIMKGKAIMDEFRAVIQRIKTEERRLLKARMEEQDQYITYTPFFVLFAAIVSILITILSYVRIKRDLEERSAKQQEDEARYLDTRRRIDVMQDVTAKIAQGEYGVRSTDDRDDELGSVSKALNRMATSLQENFEALETRNWIQQGSVKIGDAMRGERSLSRLAANLVETITNHLQAPIATLYINQTGTFTLSSSYAAKNAPQHFVLGEGLIGQAAKDKRIRVVHEVPADFVVTSSIGSAMPLAVVLVPLVSELETIAVIEIGMFRAPSPHDMMFLESNAEAMAIGLAAALAYIRMQDLLEETQAQAEELQAQHSELENLNSELEAQAQKLQASEEELRVQQEELQQTNEELEERSLMLEEKNLEVIRKARELEVTTRYKSEFLANMSHELRTPLNSILLLSRLLAENNEKNLNDEQVEYASVIQASGRGLLGLIDEILDLSKIEAGKMELEYFDVPLSEIADDMNALFKPIAREKNLALNVEISEGLPTHIETDKGRLEQILKNLLSNALKFTSNGSVSLTIKRCTMDEDRICFAVKDTGIGIPEDKQQFIFEAFQQADGSTRRKYGGTGLGLSISRELTRLLGGELLLLSEEGKGSEFTLRVPIARPEFDSEEPPLIQGDATSQLSAEETALTEKYIATVIPEEVPDDRSALQPGDRVILIVEDDTAFARSLLEITRRKGYKGVVVVRGDMAVAAARKYNPLGILLDIQLPVKSGWQVIDELKNDRQVRHIPVHMMSSFKMKNESLLKGAVDFINKPMASEQVPEIFKKIEYVLNRDSKKVMIIEDNPKHAQALAYYLESYNINSEVKSNVVASLDILKNKDVDCVILDMGIPDADAYKLLEEAKKTSGMEKLPIIIFTGKSLSMAEEQRIRQYADSIVVKTAHSYQRMLDEVSLFLHLMEEQRQGTKNAHRKTGTLSEVLGGRTVLVVDDDVRNIFSLSKSLEHVKMNVMTAMNGKEALRKLEENPDIDVVLLDMMMPEMDGYETARKIRENGKWRNLPVIAVTAKAMTGDREKCIRAGASDYITKPVDVDQLLSLLRVWLYDTYKP